MGLVMLLSLVPPLLTWCPSQKPLFSCACAYELSFHLRRQLFLADSNQVSALALSAAFKPRARAFAESLQELGRVFSFKFS